MKKCFKCNKEMPLDCFYKHGGTSDGYLGKCKECTKKDARKRENELRNNPIWVESERARQREKYSRLNYKEKQKIWNKDKPWTRSSVYSNLRRKLKTPKGIELHHWNYNDNFLEDVFFLSILEHRKIHRFLTLDLEKKIFLTTEGEYLDTKEKHLNYIKLALTKKKIN